MYCDLAAKKCTANPATVVHCNTDDDPPCLRDTCDPKTGQCAEIALPKDGTACDDGNPCTPNSLCLAGACTATANTCACQSDTDCAKKEDGNLCNGTLYCDKVKNDCVVNPATVVSCATAFDDTCLTNQCDPKTGGCGMKPALQGNQCGDGSPCSAGGWCFWGTCVTTETQVCECLKDSDCGPFEDGDACNGNLYCDKTGSKPACKINPTSIVVCKTVGDTACSKNQCQPTSGACAVTAISGSCDDSKACTISDACKNGACVGLTKFCDDSDLCTSDACVEPQGCAHLPLAASACDDANACTADACLPAKGCVNTYLDSACSDGQVCTSGDVCKTGVCVGSPNSCDDGNPCTDDSCQATTGCAHKANSVACSDGDACTDKDACAGGKCAGKLVVCDDGNPCSDDYCDPKVGCASNANSQLCDDGNACTSKDACKSGACTGLLQCNDNNLCTSDACDGGKCAYSFNTFECSDGNVCSTGDTCGNGKCAGAGKLDCNDSNLCTLDNCDGQNGCVHVANSQACDDGNACTIGDGCMGGACVGTKKLCDDGNGCTSDSCDMAKGCTATNSSALCSDGDACTTGDTCAGGKCGAGKPVNCDDGDFCTVDACDSATGKCNNVPAGAQVCDDGKFCTADACDTKLGCQHTYTTAKCEDGNLCAAGDACNFGNCKAGAALNCGDNNPCTDDGCDAKLGCIFTNNAKACDDGNGCTQQDTCKAANCVGIISCDDSNPCTDDSCDFKAGKCLNSNTTDLCDDGDACTTQSHCKGGSCQGEVAKLCEDNEQCTDNACDKAKGCLFPQNTLPCNAGVCTGEDACKAGSCTSSGKPQYWEKTYSDPGLDEDIVALLPTSDGVLAAGYSRASNTLTTAKSRLWRFGRAGTQQWTKTVNTDLNGTRLMAATAMGDGTYMAAGWWDNGTGNGTDQAMWYRFDGDGNQLARQLFGTALDDYANGIAMEPGSKDKFVVCGWGSSCGAGCNEDGWIFAFNADGTQTGYAAWTDKNQLHQHIYGCVFAGNGTFVTIGDNDDSGAGTGALGATDGVIIVWSYPGLQQLKMHRIGTFSYDYLWGVATASDGTIFAGGVNYVGSTGTRWAVHLDAKGDIAWNKTYPNSNSAVIEALVALPDGGVVATGEFGKQGEAFVQRFDSSGYEVKQSVLGTTIKNTKIFAAARDEPGAVWIAGQQLANSFDPWLFRLGPWLDNQCVAPCGPKIWTDCADGNDCTTDYCSGGCQHVGNLLPCSDGNACTESDACNSATNLCAGGVVNCDDKKPCTQDSCDPKVGCKNVGYPEGFVCGSGLKCVGGVCQ